MGVGRKKSGRREPLFDATPTPGMALRLSAEDRLGGPPEASGAKAVKAGSAAPGGGRGNARRDDPGAHFHHLDAASGPARDRLEDAAEPAVAR
ncbi:MAG: hypothetical protein K2X91_10020, partial [Thermoleophilia bacterium]|nr:hypothetical protein [Thermoleophilia bacterium]